ncbi:hypothetical protein OPKNFCMD_4675 [Methylobacterium crusticola]|uniref:TonB C-terminal domain-containing protein n=1 Tax=Methylobacterium crusticola TaxID=1697972 RepID=A0ABQ4R2L8_9HYPH|nr:energy transducer TonB [Methylobacterium crusticola]GJD51916.1 hypothetical protein OPKNFCMD_4675 [Methylobacterium crusticola]
MSSHATTNPDLATNPDVAAGAPAPRNPGPGLGLAFLAALLLHAGALGALTLWRAAPPPPPGENEIAIDLAPDLAAIDVPNEARDPDAAPPPADVVEAKEQPVVEPPSETRPVEAPPDTPETKPEESPVEPQRAEAVPEERPPETVTEAVQEPEEQVVTSTNAEAPVAPPPPAVVARAVPEPKPVPKPLPPRPKPVEARKPPPKPVREVRREAPRPKAAQRSVEPARERRTTSYASRQSEGGSAAAASNPNAARAWGVMISSAIRARARHPAGASGTVTIRFTVARSGRVLAAALAGSSGNGGLDAAALAAAAPGSSLPPAPEGVTQAQQSFSVPLRFQ